MNIFMSIMIIMIVILIRIPTITIIIIIIIIIIINQAGRLARDEQLPAGVLKDRWSEYGTGRRWCRA